LSILFIGADPFLCDNKDMKKLLYVEDEKELQTIFASGLNGLDVEISSAADASSAIKIIEEQDFDIIVLDLHYVGEGSAKDILKFIESTSKKMCVEIFIVTGFIDLKMSLSKEFDYILNPQNIFLKPDGFFELILRLKTLLKS